MARCVILHSWPDETSVQVIVESASGYPDELDQIVCEAAHAYRLALVNTLTVFGSEESADSGEADD